MEAQTTAPSHGTAGKPPSASRYGSAERRQKITARLRSVAGHVRGIERMVEEGAYCVDVMRQVLAIQKALDRINAMVLEDHLEHCATTAIRSQDPRERERTIAELLEVFEMSSKV
ncbi:MAG: metal-sensitive transcriptional regulator [Armatimonadota bacterium]|nr:metal-sensitive transcriptional regulator [Armatimonadota bacterium]